MSTIFADTMTGLLQAIAIEKGEIPVTEIKGMPAKTYRRSKNVSIRFDGLIDGPTKPHYLNKSSNAE